MIITLLFTLLVKVIKPHYEQHIYTESFRKLVGELRTGETEETKILYSLTDGQNSPGGAKRFLGEEESSRGPRQTSNK